MQLPSHASEYRVISVVPAMAWHISPPFLIQSNRLSSLRKYQHRLSWQMLPPMVPIALTCGEAVWRAASARAVYCFLIAGLSAISSSRVRAPIFEHAVFFLDVIQSRNGLEIDHRFRVVCEVPQISSSHQVGAAGQHPGLLRYLLRIETASSTVRALICSNFLNFSLCYLLSFPSAFRTLSGVTGVSSIHLPMAL